MKIFDDFPQIEQLLELARLVQQRLDEQLDDIDLDTNMFFALKAIGRITRGGSQAIRARVSDVLGISPTTLTGVFRRLISAGLVEEWKRKPFLHDSTRHKYVKLSPDGIRVLDVACERWRAINRSYLDDLKDRQLRNLGTSLAAIRTALTLNDALL